MLQKFFIIQITFELPLNDKTLYQNTILYLFFEVYLLVGKGERAREICIMYILSVYFSIYKTNV